MHCPGDENIMSIYRPEDKTADLVTSMPKEIDTDEQVTVTQVIIAAPKLEASPEQRARMQREERESNYQFMKDLEEGAVDWLSDDEFEEPEMNPKYSSYALTEADTSGHSMSTKASRALLLSTHVFHQKLQIRYQFCLT